MEETLGKNCCILKASGLAVICIYKENAASIFKITSVKDDLDKEMIIKLAKTVEAEITSKKHNVSTYLSLKKGTLNENSSDTLSCFPRCLQS